MQFPQSNSNRNSFPQYFCEHSEKQLRRRNCRAVETENTRVGKQGDRTRRLRLNQWRGYQDIAFADLLSRSVKRIHAYSARHYLKFNPVSGRLSVKIAHANTFINPRQGWTSRYEILFLDVPENCVGGLRMFQSLPGMRSRRSVISIINLGNNGTRDEDQASNGCDTNGNR